MALIVENAYLYPLENARQHKTEFYEMVHEEDPTPVLRRGKVFSMVLTFSNRPYKHTDTIYIIFKYGPKPHVTKGTMGVISINSRRVPVEPDETNWVGNVLGSKENTLTVEIYSPPSIPVGFWQMRIDTGLKTSDEENTYEYENGLYLLFNPWNCHDLVYMPEEDELDEYILTDVGKIWIGPLSSCRGKEWVFGQFDATVLQAVNILFENSQMAYESRGDPIKVSRMLSKMVNSNDGDNGVVIGNWGGEYDDGTPPPAWTGSVPILEEYLNSGVSVKYGQCWVFAGVITTICRAIGIPSRVVSNLVSAHDTNATLTIDKYYDNGGEEISDPLYRSHDSVWNYHVWNDVYMARPDLPPGYGGWQAIDATPQEKSNNFYQCGPASLEAIKNGQVGFNYDVGFFISSVNADLLRWRENGKLDFILIESKKYHIGRYILTKKPFIYDFNGEKDRYDITHLYKPREGSNAERMSLFNAVTQGASLAKKFFSLPDPSKADVFFDLRDIDTIKIGQGFSIIVRIKNKSDEVRHIKCAVQASTVYYNGVKAKIIKREEGDFCMGPHTELRFRLPVRAADYLEKLVEYSNMKILAIATVADTLQTWCEEDDIQVLKPQITIAIPNEIAVGEPTNLKLTFVNPLKIMLTGCKFYVNGPNLLRNVQILYQNIEPEAPVTLDLTITPRKEGQQTLVATFASKELSDIRGAAKTEVYQD